MSNLMPPRYCPDAIPTPRGWVHPRTGELLVSMKGLNVAALQNKPVSVAELIAEVKAEAVPVVEPVVEEVTEDEEVIKDPISGAILAPEASDEVEPEQSTEPVKRKGGRPPKAK